MAKAPGTHRILTTDEIAAAVQLARRKGRRAPETRKRLAVFRLATCCGLRASEIAGLTLADVRVGQRQASPYLRVPAAIAKGRKAREVPLTLDGETLADLTAWKAEQELRGFKAGDPFVGSLRKASWGKPLTRFQVRSCWRALVGQALGRERVAELTVHDGRHTFVSHALAKGVDPVRVQKAAGHSSLAITSIYAHVLREGEERVGDLFARRAGQPAAPAQGTGAGG